MFCGKCGNELPDDAKFCGKCGAPTNLDVTDIQEDFNVQNVFSLDGETAKSKTKTVLNNLIIAVFVIISVLIIVYGIMVVAEVIKDEKDSEDAMDSGLNTFSAPVEPAVEISNLSFDSSGAIYLKFKNISDKDIAYITFDVYFYDRMGKHLETDFTENGYVELEYTGPLYIGEEDELNTYWYLVPGEAGVVYPKSITVTFFDDTEITFKNTLYCYSNDFYGGELKD